uniref:THD domain-containing protein n=1 Tax=Oryzias sinensis TaxID=183150 RepID=A0A8C7ZA51_9TELE
LRHVMALLYSPRTRRVINLLFFFFFLGSDNQTSGDPLQWETELGNAFLGGFNYSDGNLVVPRGGFYRVFLQVAFEIPECENQALSCSVLALSEDYPEYKEILKTTDFAECCNCIKTLYTSALFSFKENTMLKVITNRPYIISKDEKLVFFGAELLPD